MGAGWFVALVVVLAVLLVGLVFTIDVFFPTPDPVEYARAHVPAEAATSYDPLPTSSGGLPANG